MNTETNTEKLEKTVEDLRSQLAKKEKALQEKDLLLRKIKKDFDDFAYIVSHDLKEPLRGLQYHTDYLERKCSQELSEKALSKLHSVQHLNKRIEKLLEAVLYYSRLNRVTLKTKLVDFDKLAHDIIALPQFKQASDLEIKILSPLPSACGDEDLFHSVLLNLVSNAAEFNTEEKKKIEIGGKSNGLAVGIYVKDNGIGIKEKYWTDIFSMFRRLHHRDKFGGGVGAGLTLTKRILELHSGKIWVAKSSEEGSIFCFSLGECNDENLFDFDCG